jgi:hypothetical protein
MRRLTLVLFFGILCSCSAMFAQQPGVNAPVTPQEGQLHLPPNTRVIQGSVIDAHGVAVPGAIVLLKDTKTLQIRSYIAKKDGTYQFYGLSTDINYQVRAETQDMTSPTKLVSVFDSKRVIKVNLKIKNKKKFEKS